MTPGSEDLSGPPVGGDVPRADELLDRAVEHLAAADAEKSLQTLRIARGGGVPVERLPEWYVTTAWALIELGRPAEAIETAHEGWRQFPDAGGLAVALGVALHDSGNPSQASEALLAAAALEDPDRTAEAGRRWLSRWLTKRGQRLQKPLDATP